MKKITISDVAQRANVSKSTVSQYLNSRFDYMGKETRQRIENAIDELGYQPNIVARSLKQKRTSTIGVIVANILHAFSTQVIRAIEDICHEHDMHVIMCNADDDPGKEEKYINMLLAKQVDGLIVFPTGGNILLYKRLIKENFPLVFIDRKVNSLPVDTLLLDNEKALNLAIEHFVKGNHKKIGIITTSLIRNVTPRVERIQGYKKALSQYGLEISEQYIKGLEIDQIKNGLREMMSLPEPPTALLAGNDLTLMEVLKFVKENNITIPDDLAVIGIDDVSFADVFNPPLTTIAQPTFAIGKKAAELLLNKIEQSIKTENTKVYRFEPELIIRQST